MLKPDDLQSINPLAFVEYNKLVNENQTRIEFYDHFFLRDIYLDYALEQAIMKAAQIGLSTCTILKSIHLAKYRKANGIYTLPSRSIVKDFVTPKVDPLINSNPAISSMMGKTDSTALKSIGDRFLYFRGSWEETAAISISAHFLINDEIDRSKQSVLTTYRSRLDEAKRTRPDLGFVWQLSNPSIPGKGIDDRWQKSDKKHWFVKCPHCNYEWYLRWPENINMETEKYICAKCHRDLPDDARRYGRWVYKRKSDISGYWISQMMAPWIPASKIIEDSKRDPAFFHNFTLGQPYVSKDYTVTRKDIINVLDPSSNPMTDVAIGVDVGVLKHYVVGNKYGIFKVGVTDSWEEIEDLRNRYGAYMVIDMMPYPNIPKRLIKNYPGKVFGHYFDTDRKMREVIRWGEQDKRGIVYSDRTRIIDEVVANILAQDIWFNLTLTDLEEYILHWGQLYRTTKENNLGIVIPTWETIEGRADHFAFATVYWYIALQKTLTQGGVVVPAAKRKMEEKHPRINEDQTMPALDLSDVVRRVQLATRRKKR